jgi:NAD(P)-dependent dehydrogenase (short-subunit alcohol dehydrogenase family)
MLASAGSISETVVFITGATQGLGLQIARVLSTPSLHPGYHVIIGALTATEGAKAVAFLLSEEPTRNLSTVEMDVTSDSSIDSAVKTITAKHGHIDVLINNAGVLLDDLTSPTTSRTLFERTFQVNVFGAASVTEAFAPLIEKSTSPCPRIVYMTSRLASLAVNSDASDRSNARYFAAYRSSKCALNMLMLHYSKLFRERGWKVNGCCPGLSKTSMTSLQDDSIKGSVEDGAINAVRLAALGIDGETGTFTSKDGPIDW